MDHTILFFQHAGARVSIFDAANASETKYLVTTSDGRALVVSAFVFTIYEWLNSPMTASQIHQALNVQLEFDPFVVQLKHLVQLGVLSSNDPTTTTSTVQPKTAIVGRMTLLNERQLRWPTQRLRALFVPQVAVLMLLVIGIVKLTYLLPFATATNQTASNLLSVNNINLTQQALYFLDSSPQALVLFLGLLGLLFLIHELGHAAACTYYGRRASSIGVGLYYTLPVMFMDATDTWGLRRWQRVVVASRDGTFQV